MCDSREAVADIFERVGAGAAAGFEDGEERGWCAASTGAACEEPVLPADGDGAELNTPPETSANPPGGCACGHRAAWC